MKQSRRNKLIAAAAATAAGQIINNNNKLTTTILRIAVINEINREVKRKKPMLLRKGSLPTPGQSLWRRIDDDGDELEFFFTAFTRQSFDLLVELASPQLNNHPITPRFGTPQNFFYQDGSLQTVILLRWL